MCHIANPAYACMCVLPSMVSGVISYLMPIPIHWPWVGTPTPPMTITVVANMGHLKSCQVLRPNNRATNFMYHNSQSLRQGRRRGRGHVLCLDSFEKGAG